MSKRTVYHVVPGDGEWKVERVGGERASGVFGNKSDAVDRARELAKNSTPGQIVIHKQDGTIQTEHTYGDDPYPPKG